MDRPLKVATPELALTVTVPASAPGPPGLGVPDVIDSVTGDESLVTVLPPASCTVTLGWVGKATPPVELAGCWLNANLAAGPTVMLKGLLSVTVRELSAA